MATTIHCRQIPVPPIVIECYKTMLGYPPTHAIMYQLLKYLEVADISLICAAIEYTAFTAPRPTWAYANAVISRQIAKGSRTSDDFNRDNAAFRQQQTYQPRYYQPSPHQVMAQQYNQRDYNQREIDLTDIITTTNDMLESGLITPDAAEKVLAAAKLELTELKSSGG